jgi:hypothetical protein
MVVCRGVASLSVWCKVSQYCTISSALPDVIFTHNIILRNIKFLTYILLRSSCIYVDLSVSIAMCLDSFYTLLRRLHHSIVLYLFLS